MNFNKQRLASVPAAVPFSDRMFNNTGNQHFMGKLVLVHFVLFPLLDMHVGSGAPV